MADIYKVGVSLVMTSNAAAILSTLSKSLLGINTQVKQVEGSFGRLKTAMAGALGIWASDKMLHGLGAMVKYGSEITHQQEMMRVAGMSQQEIAEATAKAYEISAKVQTTTIADNLAHLKELRYALGDFTKAQAVIEEVSKANAVLQSVTGNNQADQVWSLIKSAEIKGTTIDPASLKQYLDDATKVVIATGGKVTPEQFFQTFKYGRTAMQGWNEDFVAGALPRLMQSMGGGGGGGRGGPGNALMSAFGEIVHGQMSKTSAGEFANLGLATVQPIKGSAKSQVDVASKALMIANPYEWVQQVLMPALHKGGFDKTQEGLVAEIGKMFPNRTAGQVMTEFALQGRYHEGANSQFEKDIALHKQALSGAPAYDELKEHDPTTIMNAFEKQWTSLLQALGSAAVGPAMEGMKAVTNAITALTGFAKEHETAMKVLAEGFGALAIGLAAFGAVAITAALVTVAGVPAIIAAALVGIAAAFTALAAVNWSTITGWISGFGDAIVALWHKLVGALGGDAGIPVVPNLESYDGNGSGLLHRISYGPSGSAGLGGSASTGGGATARGIGGGVSVPGNLGNPMGGAGGGANLMHGQYGGIGQNLTTIDAGGHRITVNAASAPYIKGFVDEIAAAGAPINSIYGFSPRHIAGSSRWSQHAYGNAVDIDQHSRNSVDRAFSAWASTHMSQLRAALGHWGIVNGGDWRNPDFGHFEWGGGRRTGAIPKPKDSGGVLINQPILLDGQVVARNVVKRITSRGNMVASGGRMTDTSLSRPISI